MYGLAVVMLIIPRRTTSKNIGKISYHQMWQTRHWNLKNFGQKAFFRSIMNMFQGLPNPGFKQEKVQKGDFLKKPSQELFFCFVLGSYESLEHLEG